MMILVGIQGYVFQEASPDWNSAAVKTATQKLSQLCRLCRMTIFPKSQKGMLHSPQLPGTLIRLWSQLSAPESMSVSMCEAVPFFIHTILLIWPKNGHPKAKDTYSFVVL